MNILKCLLIRKYLVEKLITNRKENLYLATNCQLLDIVPLGTYTFCPLLEGPRELNFWNAIESILCPFKCRLSFGNRKSPQGWVRGLEDDSHGVSGPLIMNEQRRMNRRVVMVQYSLRHSSSIFLRTVLHNCLRV